jgi:long-subunit acyl-CoA synthetase (AMP-forming)
MHDAEPNPKEAFRKIWRNICEEPGSFCLCGQGVEKSYQQLRDAINSFKAFVGEREQLKIVVSAQKSFEHYAIALGAVLSNNVWVPVSLDTPIERMKEILTVVDPDIIIFDKSSKSKFLNNLNDKCNFVELREVFKNEAQNKALTVKACDEETAIIYFTSGSSGVPKGVKITQIGMGHALNNVTSSLGLKKQVWGDFHDLSFVISINILFTCIYTSGKIYCATSPLEQMQPGAAIIENNIDCVVTVPSTLKRLALFPQFDKIFDSLQIIMSCGEPLPLELLEKYILKQDNLIFFNCYGSTEATTWVFFHRCKKSDPDNFAGFGFAPIGRPLPGTKIKLSEDGLLLIQTKQITPGYLNAEQDSHLIDLDNEKWFSTGDIVEQVDNTFLCKGREDGLIKLNGYRIHLSEIETRIRKNFNIEDCMCIITAKDPSWIKAVIVGKEAPSLSQLREVLSSKLPKYMLPRSAHQITEKPVNKNGKLDRAKIKKLFS